MYCVVHGVQVTAKRLGSSDPSLKLTLSIPQLVTPPSTSTSTSTSASEHKHLSLAAESSGSKNSLLLTQLRDLLNIPLLISEISTHLSQPLTQACVTKNTVVLAPHARGEVVHARKHASQPQHMSATVPLTNLTYDSKRVQRDVTLTHSGAAPSDMSPPSALISLRSLPLETLLNICTFLPAKQILKYSIIHRHFLQIESSQWLWKILCLREFPSNPNNDSLVRYDWKSQYLIRLSLATDALKQQREVREALQRRYNMYRPGVGIFPGIIGGPQPLRPFPPFLNHPPRAPVRPRPPWRGGSRPGPRAPFFRNL